MLLITCFADDETVIYKIDFIIADVTARVIIIVHLAFDIAKLFTGNRSGQINHSGKGRIIIRLKAEGCQCIQIFIKIFRFQGKNPLGCGLVIGDGQVFGLCIIGAGQYQQYQRDNQNDQHGQFDPERAAI